MVRGVLRSIVPQRARAAPPLSPFGLGQLLGQIQLAGPVSEQHRPAHVPLALTASQPSRPSRRRTNRLPLAGGQVFETRLIGLLRPSAGQREKAVAWSTAVANSSGPVVGYDLLNDDDDDSFHFISRAMNSPDSWCSLLEEN